MIGIALGAKLGDRVRRNFAKDLRLQGIGLRLLSGVAIGGKQIHLAHPVAVKQNGLLAGANRLGGMAGEYVCLAGRSSRTSD